MSKAIIDQIKASVAEVVSTQFKPSSPTSQNGGSVSQAIMQLQKGQKELEVEKRVSALKTDGAQSQYRSLALMGLKLQSAVDKIDELRISCEDTDDPMYLALSSVREDLSSAQEIGQERLDLITKADSEPEVGWRALTKYEEVLKSGKSSNPEREKLFAECVRKVKEEKKKKATKVTAPQLAASLHRPFQSGPGYSSGYNGFTSQGYEHIQGFPFRFYQFQTFLHLALSLLRDTTNIPFTWFKYENFIRPIGSGEGKLGFQYGNCT